MIKKTITILVAIICISCSLYAAGKSTGYYLGLELTKKPNNSFVITNGSPVKPPTENKGDLVPPDWPKFGTLGERPTLQFSTPVNKIGSGESLVQRFGIQYTLQTAGTFLVFFSSKSDLGYYTVEETNYKNPYMMKASKGKMSLNYRVDVVDEYDQSVASFDPHGARTEITSKTVFPDTAVGGTDPIINTGAVFKHVVKNPDKTQVEGLVNFKLTMTRQSTETFDSGLYTGYIIVHFNVNE